MALFWGTVSPSLGRPPGRPGARGRLPGGGGVSAAGSVDRGPVRAEGSPAPPLTPLSLGNKRRSLPPAPRQSHARSQVSPALTAVARGWVSGLKRDALVSKRVKRTRRRGSALCTESEFEEAVPGLPQGTGSLQGRPPARLPGRSTRDGLRPPTGRAPQTERGSGGRAGAGGRGRGAGRVSLRRGQE